MLVAAFTVVVFRILPRLAVVVGTVVVPAFVVGFVGAVVVATDSVVVAADLVVVAAAAVVLPAAAVVVPAAAVVVPAATVVVPAATRQPSKIGISKYIRA